MMTLTSVFVSPADRVLEFLDRVFQRLGGAGRRQGPLALGMLAPALAVLGGFGIAPVFYAVYLSFHGMRAGADVFVGLANYVEVLGAESFWNSVLVTVFYVLGTVPPAILISFVAAELLRRVTRFRGVFRTLYFLPFVTSVVASATVWRVLLDPTAGVANELTAVFGIPAQTWLLEPRGVLHLATDGMVPASIGPSLALCCIMLFEIWRSAGFMVVVFLAALSAIPRELEDAARLDGAGTVQVTRRVTLPLLSPTLFFLTVVSVIGSFQTFSSFYALTRDGRGPLDTTQNIIVYIYNTNFYQYERMGYGAAVAVLLALTLIALTAFQWRVLGRRVFYQ